MPDENQTSIETLDGQSSKRVDEFNFDSPKPIKGYPELHWRGKRPFTSTRFYPAQLKEVYGESIDGFHETIFNQGEPEEFVEWNEINGWINKIYWGDNLQVMSHLLKEYRGKINLAYIDPPFDSKANYQLKISLKNKLTSNDQSAFEEKQYSDIWTNDEYLQFIYERLVLIHELLSDSGSLWFHCDWHRSHHLRCILGEIFGENNLQNEVIWQRTDPHNDAKSRLGWIHDTIFWYSKNRKKTTYNWNKVVTPLGENALKEYSLIEFEDGTPATQSQVAKDIATFLVWTASPEHDLRKKLFIKVLIKSH